jgi:hypothetical protein
MDSNTCMAMWCSSAEPARSRRRAARASAAQPAHVLGKQAIQTLNSISCWAFAQKYARSQKRATKRGTAAARFTRESVRLAIFVALAPKRGDGTATE